MNLYQLDITRRQIEIEFIKGFISISSIPYSCSGLAKYHFETDFWLIEFSLADFEVVNFQFRSIVDDDIKSFRMKLFEEKYTIKIRDSKGVRKNLNKIIMELLLEKHVSFSFHKFH